MDSSHDEKRTNVEDDRLSSLPDDLIHRILSLISIKHAIQTSVLSSRWRFIWTSMPYLYFSRDDFSSLTKFSKFVTHVLFDRNNIEVPSVKLNLFGEDSDVFIKKILKYGFSHNIQHLDVACLHENVVDFPLCLFRSRSLKHLRLTMKVFSTIAHQSVYSLAYVFKATSIWELPALTTLYLDNAAFYCDEDTNDKCIDLFSKCANLKDLTLKACYTEGFKGLNICLPKLSNLTIDIACGSVEVFDIVAPQLKNLTIRSYFGQRYLLFAPNLVLLFYEGCYCLQLATDVLSLEKADICVTRPKDARQALHMLQRLHNVKFLTLNVEIVELLSSSVKLITRQPSPFANLKSLKIQPHMEFSNLEEHEGVEMSVEVKSYLLDGSPDATLTLVTREDVRAIKNTKLAQNLIRELSVLLDQEKANTETEMAEMHEQGKKAHVNTDMSWNDLSVQIQNGEEKASEIISKLKEINEILEELPQSNRAAIQPSFSTLCTEADTVTKKITDVIKMVCDENQRCLNVCFHDLTTALQPSS